MICDADYKNELSRTGNLCSVQKQYFPSGLKNDRNEKGEEF